MIGPTGPVGPAGPPLPSLSLSFCIRLQTSITTRITTHTAPATTKAKRTLCEYTRARIPVVIAPSTASRKWRMVSTVRIYPPEKGARWPLEDAYPCPDALGIKPLVGCAGSVSTEVKVTIVPLRVGRRSGPREHLSLRRSATTGVCRFDRVIDGERPDERSNDLHGAITVGLPDRDAASDVPKVERVAVVLIAINDGAVALRVYKSPARRSGSIGLDHQSSP